MRAATLGTTGASTRLNAGGCAGLAEAAAGRDVRARRARFSDGGGAEHVVFTFGVVRHVCNTGVVLPVKNMITNNQFLNKNSKCKVCTQSAIYRFVYDLYMMYCVIYIIDVIHNHLHHRYDTYVPDERCTRVILHNCPFFNPINFATGSLTQRL